MTLKKNWQPFAILAVCIIVMIVVFSVNGLYDLRVDGLSYASLIRSFSTGHVFDGPPDQLMRVFKPFYGVVGGTILHAPDPFAIILVINILMYFVLALSSYAIFERLGFSRWSACIGAVWIATAYPLLKYGLALGTDISGWALAAATVAIGLRGIKRDSLWYLGLASLVGFVGATAKETGPLGLIVICLMVLWSYRSRGWKVMLARLAFAAGPAAVLYAVLMLLIAGHVPTIFQWLHQNNDAYQGSGHHSFLTWIAVEASTFNLLWVYAFAGLAGWKGMDSRRKLFIVCAFIATLPVLIWPIFISRIVFVQFIWVLPLVLIGFERLSIKIKNTWVRIAFTVLPVIASVALFFVSAGGSLFGRP